MEKIQIVAVSDDNYAQHLGVMLISLFEQTTSRKLISIYIIDGGISSINKSYLTETVKEYGSDIFFVQIDKKKYKELAVKDNMSHAAYYKLSIPEALHFLNDKVLFLDCDLIVNRDIKGLWDIDISNYILAAVVEPEFNRHGEIKIAKTSKYFNSGVMLINLKLWRENKVSEKALDYLVEMSSRIKLHDQDAFNAVLVDKAWLPLPNYWNQRTSKYQLMDSFKLSNENIFSERENELAILHYTGYSKPWHYLSIQPFSDVYERYLRKSRWKNYEPLEKKEMIKLLSKKLVVFGTGKASQLLTERLICLGHSIEYYVDNNKEQWNSTFYNKKIYGLEKLATENKKEIYILVASMYYEEIKLQLEKLNFIESIHFNLGWKRR